MENFEKGTSLFRESLDVSKREGMIGFIKKDPLELKKTLMVLGIFFGLIYLYNNL